MYVWKMGKEKEEKKRNGKNMRNVVTNNQPVTISTKIWTQRKDERKGGKSKPLPLSREEYR